MIINILIIVYAPIKIIYLREVGEMHFAKSELCGLIDDYQESVWGKGRSVCTNNWTEENIATYSCTTIPSNVLFQEEMEERL